jgi:acetoin utilization protein AcuB
MKTRARSRRAADRGSASWIVAEPVRRWMRQPATTIGADTAVRDAGALMREHGIHHLPVVDGRGRLLGIVTDRDLRQVVFDAAVRGRLGEAADRLGDLPVRDVMTWGVMTSRTATDLRAAAALMRERRLGALPVVDGARLVGMLTEHDLVAALLALLRERVAGPGPADRASRDEYDFGFVPPANADPWLDGSGGQSGR